MTVMMYINYAVHQRDKSWQDVKTWSTGQTDPWSETHNQPERANAFHRCSLWTEREDDGLVRRTICSMIFTFSAAPASQAHNDGSRCEKASGHGDDVKVLQERYEGKLMSFAFIFISPCRRVSFSETLKLHFP